MPESKPVPACHCGRPLHYTNPTIQAYVQSFVDELGEFIPVRGSDGRSWLVSRHYIALHGIKEELLPTYGFEEVVGGNN